MGYFPPGKAELMNSRCKVAVSYLGKAPIVSAGKKAKDVMSQSKVHTGSTYLLKKIIKVEKASRKICWEIYSLQETPKQKDHVEVESRANFYSAAIWVC